MSGSVHIHWFRQDLRLSDNPSLSAAAAKGAVLPVYILDDANAGDHRMGGASRWWLHHSLTALNQALDGKLIVLSGNPAEILANLADAVAAAGGESASTVNRALQDRVSSNFTGLTSSLDKNIAELPFMEDFPTIRQDPSEIAKQNAKKTQPAREKAYEKAYKTQIDYLSPKGQKVQEALN